MVQSAPARTAQNGVKSCSTVEHNGFDETLSDTQQQMAADPGAASAAQGNPQATEPAAAEQAQSGNASPQNGNSLPPSGEKFLAQSQKMALGSLNLRMLPGALPDISSVPLPSTGENRPGMDEIQAFNPLLTAAGQGVLTARGAAALTSISTPVGQPGWGTAVGERIQWMLGQQLQQAEVRLSPPHLGPLEIRISLQNDIANVHFAAAHAATREAIEAALPRLREMLGEANLNLGNVDVGSQEAGGSWGGRQEEGTATGNPDGLADVLDPMSGVLIRRWSTDSLVDDYV